MSLNVTTLISNLLPMLHSNGTVSPGGWTDTQLTHWFVDHLKRHAEKHGVFVVRDTSITLVNGTATYTAPTRHLNTIHVAIDGVPMVASSTTEIEALDEGYATTVETTARPASRWYTDRVGSNIIGIYPVPTTSFAAGDSLDVIYHQYPCNLDDAHTDTDIDVPVAMGDQAELAVLAEAYAAETDGQMVETAQAARQVVSLIDEIVHTYWGGAQ